MQTSQESAWLRLGRNEYSCRLAVRVKEDEWFKSLKLAKTICVLMRNTRSHAAHLRVGLGLKTQQPVVVG